jgi:hypothetical protein
MAYVRKPKTKAQIAIDRALGPKESTPREPKKPLASHVIKPRTAN